MFSEAEGRAAALVEAARKAGADAADVLYIGDASTEVQVRLGALEDVGTFRRRGDRPAAVRRPALGERFLLRPVRRRAGRAGRARGGDGARGARRSLCRPRARGAPAIAAARPIWKPTTAPIHRPRRSRNGRWRSRRRRASSAGITNSEGAGVSAGRNVIALATSHGFVRGYTTSGYSGGVSVIAGTARRMQRDYASHNVRHFDDLDGPEALGPARRRASREASRPRQARQRHDAGPVRPARRRQPDRPSAGGDERSRDRPPHQLPARPRGGASLFRRHRHRRRSAPAAAASAPSRSTAKAWRPARRG